MNYRVEIDYVPKYHCYNGWAYATDCRLVGEDEMPIMVVVGWPSEKAAEEALRLAVRRMVRSLVEELP